MRASFSSQMGFTLLEILIAMTILFSVAAASLSAYQNISFSIYRSTDTIDKLTWLTPIMQNIYATLKRNEQGQLNGEDVVNDVNYQWEAVLFEQSPPPSRLEADSGTLIEYAPRYRLYQVSISVSHTQNSAKPRSYNYMELVWSPVAVPK